jgi:hypothetical protein
MRLYDVEESAQTLNEDIPVFNKSSFGMADNDRKSKLKKLIN